MGKRISFVALAILLASLFVVGISAQTADFELSGDNVVPPVSTAASGSCSAYLNASKTEFTLSCDHDALSTGAQIREGAPDSNGAIVFLLGSDTTITETVSAATLEEQKNQSNEVAGIDFAEFLDLLSAGSLYVNVDTSANPAGELRGNIPALAHQLFFSQFGAGGGLTSEIVVLNTSATTANAVVDFYDPDGNQFLPSETLEVPGYGSWSFSSSPDGETPVPGTARVIADRSVGASVVFDAFGLITGVAPSPALHVGVVPVNTDPTGVRTAVALSNPDPDGINVDLSLYDADGVLEGQITYWIPGNGQLAKFVDEIFSLGDAPFTGVLRVEALGDVSSFTGVGVQQSSSQLTTVQFTSAQ